MRSQRLVLLATLLGAGTASAQRPCAVAIARAPDSVRAAIEAWVDREPTCTVDLEVRVVPTDGGLYILARDERGRTYERIVPDAQTAGVLVASWMADDSMPSVHVAPRAVATIDETLAPDAPWADIVEPEAPAARHETSRWFSLEGLVGGSVGGGTMSGVRANLDLASFGSWSLGANVGIARGGVGLTAVAQDATSIGAIQSTTDIKAVAYLVRQIDLGEWHVRPAFGFGAIHSTVHVDPDFAETVMPLDLEKTSPMVELSFGIARDVGPSWVLQGGFVLDVTSQEMNVPTVGVDGIAFVRRSMDVALAFGVGRRL